MPEELSHPRRRKTDGYGPLNLLNGDTPWYARLLVVVLFYFGVPTVIVGILFGMGAGWIPSPITSTHAIAAKAAKDIENLQRNEEYKLRLMGLICRNTSYTTVVQAECQRLVEDASWYLRPENKP